MPSIHTEDLRLSWYVRFLWAGANLLLGVLPGAFLFFHWVQQNCNLPEVQVFLSWPWVDLSELSLVAKSAWNFLLFILFGLVHSILAQRSMHAWIEKVLPPQIIRSFFLCVTGVGTFGTLVGAGGGFILMPIFFFLYPETPPDQLTAISLSVVFLNAFSGSIAYSRAGRIDYRSGIIFSLASAPGAILGAVATGFLSRRVFDPIFATLLILAGIYLVLRPNRMDVKNSETVRVYPSRLLIEKDGTTHQISYHLTLGIGVSGVVGFVSSLLGIGGGIIHVPALVQLLHFPVHIATATSHFILAVMSFVGVLVHLWNGSLGSQSRQILFLAPGVVVGAQIGALLSHRIHGNSIIRVLALALVFVGVRLLLSH